ncbi:hypothetical protein DFH28DRAFT_882621 [Melampsora americana]|nr:hypothetical protein DFH28DRAFT_882621 [Melampsora americana]
MNELCGDVNATADGIIGTQTATQPIIDRVIDPPADDPVANNHPADNHPADNHPAEDRFDPSDGPEDESDSAFDLPPPLNRRGLDEPHPHSQHSSDDSDRPITQTSTPATLEPRSFNKKPTPRIRPNTKAKLASSLDNSAELLKKQAAEAFDRDKLRAKTIAAHDAAKENIIVTQARLEQEAHAFKHTAIPSQDKAMDIFNKEWREHFNDNKAATEAIILFEQEDKCRTFINLDPELRWSWLALSLGYHVVDE